MINVKKDFALSEGINSYVAVEFSYTGDIVLDGSNDPLATQDSYNLLNLRWFVNFDKYDVDVVVWGRNILNEEYIKHIDFNTPLQEGKLNAYVANPATFGITLRKRF